MGGPCGDCYVCRDAQYAYVVKDLEQLETDLAERSARAKSGVSTLAIGASTTAATPASGSACLSDHRLGL